MATNISTDTKSTWVDTKGDEKATTFDVALRDGSTVEIDAHSVDLYDDTVVLYGAPDDKGSQKARAVFPKQAVYGVWPKICTRSFD